MLKKIDHIDICVNNLKEEVDFLLKLGFKIVRETPAPRSSVELKLPGENQVVLEIKPSKDKKLGIQHIAFKQTDCSSFNKIKDLGINISEPKIIKNTGRKVCNFIDPSGINWQITD